MSDWPRVKISEVCELIVDCVNKTAPRVEYETPYKMIRTPNIKNGRVDRADCRFVEKATYEKWTRRAKVLRGDVLLTREAPMGEVGYVDFDDTVFLGQRIMQYRVNQKILDSRFLLYAFLSADLQHQFHMHEGSGSVVSHIKVPDCSNFEINLPPIGEQKRIAKILGDLDDKIELNRQTNQTLEQIAQAIFKSWFVDFEPTRAKIKAKQQWLAKNETIETSSPTCYAEEFDNVKQNKISLQEAMTQAAMAAISGKSIEELEQLSEEQLKQLKETADLFPDALVDSELGEVPEGWDIKQLEEIAENHSTTFDFSRFEDVVFVNTGDVLEGRFLHKNYSSKKGLPGQAKKTIKRDDILYSEIRPKNKRYAYVSEECSDYVVSTKFMIIRSHSLVHPRYLYQILRQQKTINEFNLIAESRSGTFPQITFDSIGYLPIVVPSKEIQRAFMSFFTPIVEKINLVVKEEKSLVDLRDALLPRLLSGELEIKIAETKLEKTA